MLFRSVSQSRYKRISDSNMIGLDVVNVGFVFSKVFWACKPFDSSFKTFADAVVWLETCQFTNFAVIAPQAENFRFLGTNALFVDSKFYIAVHELANQVQSIANRNFKV